MFFSFRFYLISIHADENCKGVCVADRIAEYCEAYLTSDGLCKSGTKCCVSLDDYASTKLPKDIYIPASKFFLSQFIIIS